jgi:hypothetical protein
MIDNYPPDLMQVRDGLLHYLENDPFESQKLISCQTYSNCHSIHCPSCLRLAGINRKDRLLAAASRLAEKHLKFATFPSRFCNLDDLREAAQQAMEAGRKTLRALRTENYTLRLETSWAEGQIGYNTHLHAILDTPTGGRNHISSDQWSDTWLAHLPQSLHHQQDAAHVKRVRNLAATCHYIAKSPYAQCADVFNVETIARIVEAQIATKGLQKFNLRGTFAA